MATAVIEIFDPVTGEAKRWERFSSRLAQFLSKFPIEKGWRVVRESRLSSASAPELVTLYEAAFKAGVNPRDAGLPPMPQGVVFVARLISPDGHEVASGSACSMASNLFTAGASQQRRDYEMGETAAFQRLLAAVGIGGEIFDTDEDLSIELVGSKARPSTSGTVIPIRSQDAEQVESKQSVQSGSKVKANDGGLPDVLTPEAALAGIVGEAGTGEVVAPEEVTQGRTVQQDVVTSTSTAQTTVVPASATTVPRHRKAKAATDAQLVAGLKNMITTLARQAGVTPNSVSTLDEAQQEQIRLVTLLASK